jgi:hypothetical protein
MESKPLTVFEIKKEFYDLANLMVDDLVVDETTGEILEDNTELLQGMLAELEATKEEKLTNIEYIKRDLKIRQEALKAEARRIAEKAKSLENNQKRLLELQDFLLGGEKLKGDKFTFFYGSSESLDIVDESAVPADYVSFVPKVDKTALKKDVKNGLEIEGITINKKISLRVR